MMAIIRRHNGTDWETLDAKNLDGISDGTLTITPDQVGNLMQLNTTNNDNIVNAINEVKQTAGDDLLDELDVDDKQIKRLLAYEQTKGRVLGGSGVFVDLFDGNLDAIAHLDTTKTNATSTLSAGNTTIPVQSATGFSVGQEITVFDDVNLERPTITGINGNNLQVTALTKNFKNGATVCRSSVIVDTINKCLKFGGWDSRTTYNQFSTVVGSNYSLAGNGGRKLVRLSNGWLVAAVRNASTSIIFYKSSDNGVTWSQLCYASITSTTSSWAITSRGTIVYAIFQDAGWTTIPFCMFDATTVANTAISLTTYVDTGQTANAVGGVSLTINAAGTELHAAWSSRNSTYQNSFNIRYAKYDIASNTWGSVEQVTNKNTTGWDNKNPCIVVRSDGNPTIIFDAINSTGEYRIYANSYSGTAWSTANSSLGIQVYGGSTYAQSNPCAVVDGNGVIHVVWHGKDATDSSKFNIRYSKSTDGGSTWSSPIKLTSGNVYDQMNPTAT